MFVVVFLFCQHQHIIIIIIISIDFLIAILKLKAITNERLHDTKRFECMCKQKQINGEENPNESKQRVEISDTVLVRSQALRDVESRKIYH